MDNFVCNCCNYNTNHKGNYQKHIQTKRHKKKSAKFSPNLAKISPPNISENNESSENNLDPIPKKQKTYECKYCDKQFKHQSSLSKHIKYSCKDNKDEGLKELARLLNEAIKDKDKELQKMQKQIEKLTNKLQIQNINNNTQYNILNNVNNAVNNVYLLNYNNTDYSHLKERDYIKCISDCNHCVKTLIEKVHFNVEKQENMNIYISSIKGNYVMVYKDNSWQIQSKKDQMEDLYNYNEVVLENWYDDYKEKYPNIIKSFQRYLKNKDDSDVINSVKEEILVMLYNKRKIVNNSIAENDVKDGDS